MMKLMLFFLMFLGGVTSSAVWAHKLNVFAFVEGRQVFVEGYFSDGVRPRGGEVTVFGPDGVVLAQGRTDEEGSFVFDRPAVDEGVRIVLNAGMGHQSEYVLSAEDVGGTTAASGLPAEAGGEAAPADRYVGTVEPQADQADLDQRIMHAVAVAVKPLAREIAQLRQRTRTADLVAGVGFIVGVLGGWAYYQSMRRRQPSDK